VRRGCTVHEDAPRNDGWRTTCAPQGFASGDGLCADARGGVSLGDEVARHQFNVARGIEANELLHAIDVILVVASGPVALRPCFLPGVVRSGRGRGGRCSWMGAPGPPFGRLQVAVDGVRDVLFAAREDGAGDFAFGLA
jgi:hypothetical protein